MLVEWFRHALTMCENRRAHYNAATQNMMYNFKRIFNQFIRLQFDANHIEWHMVVENGTLRHTSDKIEITHTRT